MIFYVLLFEVMYLAWCDLVMDLIASVNLRKNAKETLVMIRQLFWEESMSCTQEVQIHWDKVRMRQVNNKVRSIFIISFHTKAIVHKEILAGQTIKSAYYCDMSWWLHENVGRLCPKLWWQKNWLLHHNTIFHPELFLLKTPWLSSPPPKKSFLFPWFKIPPFYTTEVIQGRTACSAEHPHRRQLLRYT
jgi:hypothetical protein